MVILEIFRLIKDYLSKRKLKKLLKERIIKMEVRKEIKENEFMIKDMIMSDTEVVDRLMQWASKYFIFRQNDVFLPEIPDDMVFPNVDVINHPEIKISSFRDKYGNFALKYLLYNAFISGYEAGKYKGSSDERDKLADQIGKIVEESKAKIRPIKNIFSSEPSEEVEEEIKNHEEYLEKLAQEERNINEEFDNEEDELLNELEDISFDEDNNSSNEKVDRLLNNLSNDIEVDEPISKYEEDIEEEISRPKKKRKKKNFLNRTEEVNSVEDLDLDPSSYPERTYEKFITTVIENKLHQHGMNPNDIKISSFPTFVLGEVLFEVEKADTINKEQEKIKNKFYNYLENLHERITKENTTV